MFPGGNTIFSSDNLPIKQLRQVNMSVGQVEILLAMKLLNYTLFDGRISVAGILNGILYGSSSLQIAQPRRSLT